MRSILLISILGLLCVSCATSTRQTDALVRKHRSLPGSSRIIDVPHFKQSKNHCGPQALAMMLNHSGKKVSVSDMKRMSFTKSLDGTFQSDILSTSRRSGMLTLPVNNLHDLLKEVSDKNPVLVFQNLGFSFMEQWHYAVVTGYDLSGPDVYLHTGNKKNQKTDMRFFERSWKLGGFWGIVVLPPGEISRSHSLEEHIRETIHLEEAGLMSEAKISYERILLEWPESLFARLGLSNMAYAQKDFLRAENLIREALVYHPESAILWHNLAFIQAERKHFESARESSKKALSYVSEEERAKFQESLKELLAEAP